MSNNTHPSGPGSQALRKHRISLSGSRYFVTVKTEDRETELTEKTFWDNEFLPLLQSLESPLAAVVLMPDHFHWIFELRGNLSTTVRSCKGPLSVPLRKMEIRWQSGFFEHRIRPEEDLHAFLRYLLANPYRAGLIPLEESWPFWYCHEERTGAFMKTTNNGRPFPEWLLKGKPWQRKEIGA